MKKLLHIGTLAAGLLAAAYTGLEAQAQSPKAQYCLTKGQEQVSPRDALCLVDKYGGKVDSQQHALPRIPVDDNKVLALGYSTENGSRDLYVGFTQRKGNKLILSMYSDPHSDGKDINYISSEFTLGVGDKILENKTYSVEGNQATFVRLSSTGKATHEPVQTTLTPREKEKITKDYHRLLQDASSFAQLEDHVGQMNDQMEETLEVINEALPKLQIDLFDEY